MEARQCNGCIVHWRFCHGRAETVLVSMQPWCWLSTMVLLALAPTAISTSLHNANLVCSKCFVATDTVRANGAWGPLHHGSFTDNGPLQSSGPRPRHAARGPTIWFLFSYFWLAMASAATTLLWKAWLCYLAQNCHRRGYSVGKVLIATFIALQSHFCLNNYVY